MHIIASGPGNTIKAVLEFCDRHGLIPCWQGNKQHWEIRTHPSLDSSVAPIDDQSEGTSIQKLNFFDELDERLRGIEAMACILSSAASSDAEDVDADSLSVFAYNMKREATLARNLLSQVFEPR